MRANRASRPSRIGAINKSHNWWAGNWFDRFKTKASKPSNLIFWTDCILAREFWSSSSTQSSIQNLTSLLFSSFLGGCGSWLAPSIQPQINAADQASKANELNSWVIYFLLHAPDWAARNMLSDSLNSEPHFSQDDFAFQLNNLTLIVYGGFPLTCLIEKPSFLIRF